MTITVLNNPVLNCSRATDPNAVSEISLYLWTDAAANIKHITTVITIFFEISFYPVVWLCTVTILTLLLGISLAGITHALNTHLWMTQLFPMGKFSLPVSYWFMCLMVYLCGWV